MVQQRENPVCGNCGESIKKTWKLCPACETALHAPMCPRCALPVKENWKRCPECESYLFCEDCGSRMDVDEKVCGHCKPKVIIANSPKRIFHESHLGIEFLWVPGGEYEMGDTFDMGMENEKPVHTVILSGFYMAKYPITQMQWSNLMGYNPSRFKGENRPVEQVTWTDVQQFINELSKKHKNAFEFSLPSEAQWEYAGRSGGKNEKFSGSDSLLDVGWFDQNSNDSSQPVGQKSPNGLGLYDMSGNVWEWCQDTFFNDAYERHKKENAIVLDRSSDRVIRGGSWNLDKWSARCARRFGYTIDFYGPALGFRLIMFQNQPKKEG